MNIATEKTQHLITRGTLRIVVVALLCTFLSGFFLFRAFFSGATHIVGRVVEHTPRTLVIENRRGERTTIVASESAPNSLRGPKNDISVGDFVQAVGTRTSPTFFVSDRIREVDPPRKPR